MITEEQRLDQERLDSALDGFLGRTRICKYCKTPTEFDSKVGRYCPKKCFKGNRLSKKLRGAGYGKGVLLVE